MKEFKLLMIIEIKDILIDLTDHLEYSIFEEYRLCFSKDELLVQIEEWIKEITSLKQYFERKRLSILQVRKKRIRKRIMQSYNLKLWINDYDREEEQHTIRFRKKVCFNIDNIINTLSLFKNEFSLFLDNFCNQMEINNKKQKESQEYRS